MSKLWYPFTPMEDWARETQLTIERGEGCYLFDSKGERYFDGTSSLWTNVHGHCHPRLNAALHQQVDKLAHSTLLGLKSEEAERLANRLVNITPAGLDHVFYSDSGSTAVEIALKQAFQYWANIGQTQKVKFVHLADSYHGDTLGAVAVGGIPIFHQVYGPLLTKQYKIPSPSPALYSELSPKESMEQSLSALRELFDKEAEKIAAFILEPLVQGAGGMLTHPKGYLFEVAKLCKEYDVLLIVDEVATGFGRTGALFACEHEDVSPDFLCLAKGITGGYLPLAATLSTSKIFNSFLAPRHEAKTFFHGHTYTGNALACAVANASLDVFEEENVIAGLDAKIKLLNSSLQATLVDPHVWDIRQCGLMVGIELRQAGSDGRLPSELAIGHQVSMQARKHNLIIRNLGDTIVLMPPLAATQEELLWLVETTSKAIEESFAQIEKSI